MRKILIKHSKSKVRNQSGCFLGRAGFLSTEKIVLAVLVLALMGLAAWFLAGRKSDPKTTDFSRHLDGEMKSLAQVAAEVNDLALEWYLEPQLFLEEEVLVERLKEEEAQIQKAQEAVVRAQAELEKTKQFKSDQPEAWSEVEAKTDPEKLGQFYNELKTALEEYQAFIVYHREMNQALQELISVQEEAKEKHDKMIEEETDTSEKRMELVEKSEEAVDRTLEKLQALEPSEKLREFHQKRVEKVEELEKSLAEAREKYPNQETFLARAGYLAWTPRGGLFNPINAVDRQSRDYQGRIHDKFEELEDQARELKDNMIWDGANAHLRMEVIPIEKW